MAVLPVVDLPPAVASVLARGEVTHWHAQPIRHANGRGVWLIMAGGVVFTGASVAALVDVAARLVGGVSVGGLASLGLALFFVVFSLMLLVWPLLSYSSMRRTHIVITDRRVLSVLLPRGAGKAARVRSFSHAECTDAALARRRGASATLVLRERVRERASDGQTVYEWDALHGLPDAERALAILRALRGEEDTSAG